MKTLRSIGRGFRDFIALVWLSIELTAADDGGVEEGEEE